MSILLIGDPGSLGEALVRRLISQGDEVRAIATDSTAGDLAGYGVHIARGTDLDSDLVERAAQDVRTIIAFDTAPEVIDSIVEGGRAARVERIVVCATSVPEVARTRLRGSDLDYVVLESPRRGLLRRGVSEGALAEAIDAADDMSGRLRLELDLNEGSAWKLLNLDPPAEA